MGGIKVIEEIYTRRSIRKYLKKEISKETIKSILKAGVMAPSPKNRQPWKFIVVAGKEKENMLSFMQKGIDKEGANQGILSQSRRFLPAAQYTLQIMQQAPLIIFVLDSQGKSLYQTLTVEEKVYERANFQSIGAAIQNMSLEAVNLGLGSLWICDIFFAYDDLNKWLNTNGEMVAALALGYADENPPSKPRKAICEVSEWRTDK
jgi:nitroreductase